ncbi:MAG: hypothetical protein JO247_23850 [Chloroflexi bacterium]|nr:hypothetical protein [Chloroflexota bacterium]
MSASLCAVLCTAALTGCIPFASSPKLAFTFTPGDTYRYRVYASQQGTNTVQGQEQPVSVESSALLTISVGAMDESGLVELQAGLSDVIMIINGSVVPKNAQPSRFAFKVMPDGTMPEGQGEGLGPSVAQSESRGGLGHAFPILPDHTVRAGDEWERDLDEPYGIGDAVVHFTSANKFVAIESGEAGHMAVVESTIQGPLNFSVDLRKAADISAVADLLAHVPANFNPTSTYRGTDSTSVTGRLNLSTGKLQSSHLVHRVDVTVSTSGLPAPGVVVPGLSAATINQFRQPIRTTYSQTEDLDLI